MEDELRKFRQRKEAEARKQELKSKIAGAWNAVTGKITAAVLPEQEHSHGEDNENTVETETRKRKIRVKNTECDSVNHASDENGSDETNNKIVLAVRCIKFLSWLFLWLGFVKIGFGAVFFAISVLYFIWTNTGNSQKRKGTKSAYSVFNENCEAIDGTLKAEHLEKQLLYGGL